MYFSLFKYIVQHRHRWLIIIATLTGITLNVYSDDTTTTAALTDLPHLAENGRFDQILALLKNGRVADQQAAVASLIKDLERFQEHEEKRAAQQLSEYEKALDEMSQHMLDNKLDNALASAIAAHGMATDPDTMLQTPKVQQLVKQANAMVQQAEIDNDWVEALAIYRALDLLFNDTAEYRDRLKRANQHTRVLRLYAPKRLEELYKARTERLGKEKEKLPLLHLDEQTWQDKLKNIQLHMLRQTLDQAARRHVANNGYKKLLTGAINAVIVMADTPSLDQTFPGLADQEKTKLFRNNLIQMYNAIQQRKHPMNFLDAAATIRRLIAINRKSVHLPEKVLIYELTEGATDTLDDFSSVIWPSDKEAFSRNTRGKFSGVGIQISIRDDRLIVVSPLEDTPAERAGIKAGDIIATVDNRDTSSWSLDRAVREITGPKGSVVTLGIERRGHNELIPFALTRAEIVIESIRGWQRKPAGGWTYFVDRELGIGYVRLSQFIPQSASDLDKAIKQMKETDTVNALILDLRFNPGGLLSSSVEVADRFLTTGPIVSTVGVDGKRSSQFRARPDHTYEQLPMVVLINEGSASASEIVSGALQDYQRAIILGTRSFGKGSVQDLFPLGSDKAYLKLTTQYYMLPGGRIIHRQPDSTTWGIEPDLTVKMTAKQMADALEFRQKVDILHRNEAPPNPENDEPKPTVEQILENALDPQLEAALLVLKTHLITPQLVMAQGKTGQMMRAKTQ